MKHHVLTGLACLLLSACVPGGEAGTTRPVTTAPLAYDLAALPLTSDTRSELSGALARLASREGARHCGRQEREFAEVSLILYAIAWEERRTAPWDPAQTQKVDALRGTWERLGGDARDVSEACEALALGRLAVSPTGN